MIARLIAAAITVLVAIAALSVSEHEAPNAGLPIVKADYPLCVTVKPPPLDRRKGVILYPNRKAVA